MRYFFTLIVLFALGLNAMGRPNVILIFTDDQGMNDVGAYGSEIARRISIRWGAMG